MMRLLNASSSPLATMAVALTILLRVAYAGNNNYYNYNQYNYNNYNNNNNAQYNQNQNYNQYNQNNAYNNYNYNQNQNYNQYNNYNDNQNYNNNNNDDGNNKQVDDDWKFQQDYFNTYGNNQADDDDFQLDENVNFEALSVLPISCMNYNNGHMIKFQLYKTANSYQCHFSEISTFVVSISHYMRAYFNYQALEQGQDFALPDDAGFLSCKEVEVTDEDGNLVNVLYARIGCMERETFTSTKLQLHYYTDAQCSEPYEDGLTDQQHARKGYFVRADNKYMQNNNNNNNVDMDEIYVVDTAVSFQVPFYKCQACAATVSGTFNKRNNHNWYDDDYVSQHGQKQYYNGDDAYQVDRDDDNYNANEDNNNRHLITMPEYLQEYVREQREAAENQWSFFSSRNQVIKPGRVLYDNYYDIGEWNMCERIYKYGIWCDADCRALDFFRTDEWSSSDIFLLSIMCTFLSGMMLLIVAKRLKAQQKARMYGDDHPLPGLPPFGMGLIFCLIMALIVILAKMKFVNETLVFAVVTCILLFIYMLKLTLFENRRPVLLAAPRHDMFDNPLDAHLFD